MTLAILELIYILYHNWGIILSHVKGGIIILRLFNSGIRYCNDKDVLFQDYFPKFFERSKFKSRSKSLYQLILYTLNTCLILYPIYFIFNPRYQIFTSKNILLNNLIIIEFSYYNSVIVCSLTKRLSNFDLR